MTMNLPIKDKLAVILGGIISGDTDRNGCGNLIDFESCAKTILHNIINPNNCDVFIHSWSTDQKKDLIRIYKPKKFLFEEQEMFGFDLSGEEAIHPTKGQLFRTVSRYMSVERGMELKRQYEIEYGFRYKWVLVFRFDYIVLKRLSLNDLDTNSIYIGYEPHWPDIDKECMIYDGFFLGSSEIMNVFSDLGTTILQSGHEKYNFSCHHLIYYRLIDLLGSSKRIKYIYNRFEDFEIWRFINNPDLNLLGLKYGILDTRERTKRLLEEIDA
uniref:Uncharacterized protein n=1 Tax=viral metagenome TaxID=1070528 RepID=A0A6M3XHP8_9ZZZZ